MICDFGIEPRVEHFASIVDVVGRYGQVEEAMDIISRMPIEPDKAVWGALLGACRVHNNVELARVAAEALMRLEPESSGPYVLLYNMYVDVERWSDADQIRIMMDKNDIKKERGYSRWQCHQTFGGVEHWKRVKGFMWKYGGGMDRVDLFRIAEEDFAKWEKKCKALKTEGAKAESVGPVVGPWKNIHNELNADSVNSFCKNDVDSFKFCIPNGVVPLHSYTNEKTQVSCSVLSSVSEAGPSSHNMPGSIQAQDAQYLRNSAGLMNLTQTCSTSKEDIIGNVHTGAPPPWFDATKGNQLDVALKSEQSDLVSSKARKSSKLNPKRVGAAWAERRKLELELEKRGELVNNNYDANWLPNFGRVWQSGTRKESRKEFRMEDKASPKADNQSEVLMPLQPYISKRMRRDTSE
ncbi:hypothetical protein DH2020_024512 [Rehmannia glutinosa]|uniref:Pentatricopeptide repeat-containing protein n=1 Tax=Rehmannia glutinosa TaxID=99300 RepID=A0ABR0W250_REHGL